VSGHGASEARRALVTGGAGFIGSHLCELLLHDGWEVFVLDDLSTGSAENVERYTDRPDFHLVVESVLGRLWTARRSRCTGTARRLDAFATSPRPCALWPA
jgi:nucleoside-diphosphate-sugar epimerase